MSHHDEFTYELERKRREELVRNQTEVFYNRYMQQYEQMIENGYSSYIPDEMNRLKSDLAQIRQNLVCDPYEAREVSYSVGNYIRQFDFLVRQNQEQFERAEQMKLEELRAKELERKNELSEIYYTTLKNISGMVANFIREELAELKKEVFAEKSSITKAEIQTRLDELVQQANKKAEEWKVQKLAEEQKAIQEEKLREAEIQAKKIEDEKIQKEFLEKISALKNQTTSSDIKTVSEQTLEIEKQLDDAVISEQTRKEVVKAIYNSLKKQDFDVSKPQIDSNGEFVTITATRPSGKRAQCKVDLHGKLSYKFDNYEGQTCLKDIEKFNVDLEQIYSIRLSDKRVIWENPDRLSREMNNSSNNNSRSI